MKWDAKPTHNRDSLQRNKLSTKPRNSSHTQAQTTRKEERERENSQEPESDTWFFDKIHNERE
jgi:hypothetical protein